MKTLVVIWVAALLSGIGTVGYINNEMNHLVVTQEQALLGKQSDCAIQCPNVELQPAPNVVQVTSTAPLQATSDVELQPALGYKALEWHVDHLEVR